MGKHEKISSPISDEPPERFRVHAERMTWPFRLAALLLLSVPAWLAAQSLRGIAETTAPEELSGAWISALVGIVVVIFLNAIIVAAETALELLKPAHIKTLEKENHGRHTTLEALWLEKGRLVASCTLWNHTLRAWMVILSFLLAPALVSWGAKVWGWPTNVGTLLLCGLILSIPVVALNLVFGELIPKTFAGLDPVRTALRLGRFAMGMALVFGLPARGLASAASLVTKRFGAKASFSVLPFAHEEIKTLAETAEQTGEMVAEEKQLLHSVFEFSDTVAREVMTPRVDLDAVAVETDPCDVIKLIAESGHSRIPVYEGTDDQIVGIVHAKDLLMAQQNGNKATLRELMRPALFVPENKPLHDLLRELRTQRAQMVVVQDEFGGTAGVVTVEDIVEELVGEIVDEYDEEEPELVPNGIGYFVGGKMNIDDLNEQIGTNLSSEEFDTIAGYVFGLFGRQPKSGESVYSDDYEFKVEQTDGRRIRKLYIAPKQESESPEIGSGV